MLVIFFSDIKGFLLNLKNIKEKISKNDLSSLPLLGNTKLPTNFNCKFYFQKVDELLNEFEKRFLDFKKFEKQFRILSNPFQKIQDPPGEIEDELIYLNESEFEKGGSIIKVIVKMNLWTITRTYHLQIIPNLSYSLKNI